MNKKIVIFTGGTGGHVIPAVNFGNYVIDQGHQCVLFVDKRGSLYSNKFKGQIHIIKSSHFKGSILFKIKSLLKLLSSFIQCLFLIIKIKPNACLSFGSYAAFAPLFITILLKIFIKINIYIHEQNTVIGKVNLIFLPFADTFFTNFKFIINLKKNI